jgi:hypothetical protein
LWRHPLNAPPQFARCARPTQGTAAQRRRSTLESSRGTRRTSFADKQQTRSHRGRLVRKRERNLVTTRGLTCSPGGVSSALPRSSPTTSPAANFSPARRRPPELSPSPRRATSTRGFLLDRPKMLGLVHKLCVDAGLAPHSRGTSCGAPLAPNAFGGAARKGVFVGRESAAFCPTSKRIRGVTSCQMLNRMAG